MRYMLMRKADEQTEEGVLPSEELLQTMAHYNERLARAGVLVGGDGLRPSREGCRITFTDGEPLVTDGPFAETRELLAGYTVLEAESLDEAIAWARQWPREDGDVTLELRRYFALEDFEPSAGVEHHRALGRLPSDMNVHLAYPGNCREAMAFYAEITGGHIEAMITFGETPAAADTPTHWHDRIIHASLNLRGRRLMGADMDGACYWAPQGAHVQLAYEEREQAEEVFARMADGGTVIMPFEETFWARGFGMVTDRFGVHWMIGCGLRECGQNEEG